MGRRLQIEELNERAAKRAEEEANGGLPVAAVVGLVLLVLALISVL